MNTPKVPSPDISAHEVEALAVFHETLRPNKHTSAVLRALLAEVERLTEAVEVKRTKNLELCATLTAREAELARVRKDAQRWQSFRHVKNIDAEMMRPASWDQYADSLIAKHLAAKELP